MLTIIIVFSSIERNRLAKKNVFEHIASWKKHVYLYFSLLWMLSNLENSFRVMRDVYKLSNQADDLMR